MQDRSQPFQVPSQEQLAAPADTSRYLMDKYRDWTQAEGIPIVEAVAVDLGAVETAPWPRFGKDIGGAFVHLKGRGDFLGMQVIDIPPGRTTVRLQHQYDEVFHVLSGHGWATVEIAEGQERAFDLTPRGLFAPPMNTPFRMGNLFGRSTVRLVCVTNLPFLMKLFRNERFLFDNPFPFAERAALLGGGGAAAGSPRMAAGSVRQTNFIANLAALELPAATTGKAGGGKVDVVLADSVLSARITDISAGTYEAANRHRPSAHIIALNGSGYALIGNAADESSERYAWRPGFAFAPDETMTHQLFNTGRSAARYLKISLGSSRYPVLARDGARARIAESGAGVHARWLAELARNGVAPRMAADGTLVQRGSSP